MLRTLPDQSVHCVVTSPPYWGLRDYGVAGQIGLEKTPEEYVEALLAVFAECHRILRDSGTFWLNLGDSYAGNGVAYDDSSSTLKGQKQSERVGARRTAKRGAGLKPKDLVGIPWAVAFALRDEGWWLRSAIIWAKPNGLPGSQDDRCTSSYEMIFMLTKSRTYWSDFDAIKTPPRESTLARLAQNVQAQAGSHRANAGGKTNGPMKAVGDALPAMMRDVWFVPPAGFRGAHFAVMPEEIARRCIAAGCPPGGTVLDPFFGAGTTGLVADRFGRDCIGVELSAANAELASQRIQGDAPLLAEVA